MYRPFTPTTRVQIPLGSPLPIPGLGRDGRARELECRRRKQASIRSPRHRVVDWPIPRRRDRLPVPKGVGAVSSIGGARLGTSKAIYCVHAAIASSNRHRRRSDRGGPSPARSGRASRDGVRHVALSPGDHHGDPGVAAPKLVRGRRFCRGCATALAWSLLNSSAE